MSQLILVVDDEVMARELLRLILGRAGYRIAEAKDGQDALEKIKELRPDLVLMDVMMPRMDGLTACRSLRADPELGKVPVIILSAKSHPSAIQEGLQAGANRYIAKPIMGKELTETIGELLSPVA